MSAQRKPISPEAITAMAAELAESMRGLKGAAKTIQAPKSDYELGIARPRKEACIPRTVLYYGCF